MIKRLKTKICITLIFSCLISYLSAIQVFSDFKNAETSEHVFSISSPGTIRFEAEYAALDGYVISSDNPSKTVERADASGGKYLAAATGDTSKNPYFTFGFTLEFDAEITMSAAYAQTENRKGIAQQIEKTYVFIIDENKTVGLSSGYTLKAREDVTDWETITYDSFTLPKGTHSVLVKVAENTGNGNPNIDYIDFVVTEITSKNNEPAVKPQYDIHTDLQYRYLNDSNVYNISEYANGVEELSLPTPITCDFSEDAQIPTAESYIIQISKTEDFEFPETISGLPEKEYDIYNLQLGEHFYFRGGINLSTISQSPIHEVSVSGQGPRNCYVDGVTNVRDIGGYASSLAEGAYIKQGLYYRGANLNTITERGKTTLKDTLGVGTEIDLRDEYQCLGPYVDGISYNAISIPSGTEYIRFEKFDKEYQQIFSIISEAYLSPVYLHCTAGADRTGIVSAMLLAVCGAGVDDITRDYLFTNFSTHGARSADSELKNWLNKLEAFDGESLADKAKSWMLSKGISNETVERIRTIFVVGYVSDTEIVFEDKIEYTLLDERGSVALGAAADSETGSSFMITTKTVNGKTEQIINITLDMLSQADGEPFSPNEVGLYKNIVVSYDNQIISSDYVIRITEAKTEISQTSTTENEQVNENNAPTQNDESNSAPVIAVIIVICIIIAVLTLFFFKKKNK